MSVPKVSPKASSTVNSSFTSSLGAPEMFLGSGQTALLDGPAASH